MPRIDLQAFEAATREIAYLAILVTGAACMMAIAAITTAWALKKMLQLLGLWVQFIRFTRQRRRR